jgi:RNA polymerase sigma factor (sigma-70 family)
VTCCDVGALFRAHAGAVRSVLRRLCDDEATVDDLHQNVFICAYRRRAKVPSDSALAKAWLLDAARKQAANWRRLARHAYEVIDLEAVMKAAAEPEDPQAHAELCDLVRCALFELEEGEREVLVRHHVVGETCEELGGGLGLTKSGAHARLRAAEERMRGIVRRDG